MTKALALALFLVGWWTMPELAGAADVPLRDVVVSGEEDFIDLRFQILKTQSVELQDGKKGLGIIFGGRMKGRDVRMGLTVMRAWKASTARPIKFFSGSVSFFRVDAASDEFVRRLAALYKVEATAYRCTEDIFATAVMLGGSAASLETRPVQMKVFFEGPKGDDYAELYVNLDVKSGIVELNEKDADYRRSIIKAFTGGKAE